MFDFSHPHYPRIFQVPIHTSAPEVQQNADEIRQLQDNVAALTAQCAQLDEANRAWQLYQQKQVDDFRNKLNDYLSIDGNTSFDEMARQIVDQVTQERDDFSEKYQSLQRANDNLQSNEHLQSIRQPYINTIDTLNQELLSIKEAYDQLDQQNQVLADRLEQQSTRTFGMFSLHSLLDI